MNQTHQPQEIEVWYVIPAIRREIAKELKKIGFNTTKIAEILGLTKAAISQYLNDKRAKEIDFPKNIKQKIMFSARKISKKPFDITVEIQKIIQEIRNTGLLCKYHKDYCAVDKACVVCIE